MKQDKLPSPVPLNVYVLVGPEGITAYTNLADVEAVKKVMKGAHILRYVLHEEIDLEAT